MQSKFCHPSRKGRWILIISLLTKPFSVFARAAKDFERRFDYVKYKIKGDAYKAWTCTFPIGGHQDIIDSFLRGSAAYPDVEIRVNPSRKQAENSIVYVPSGWKALRDAIALKRAGKITKLITGPVGDCIDDYESIILDESIDVCVVPCQWYKEKCEREAASKNLRFDNICVWPVGVDHERWTPLNTKLDAKAGKALIYVKGRGAAALKSTEDTVKKSGIEYQEIFCGSHVPGDYKAKLEWCDFVVYLGYSETQGLALAQAWSMNRPTLVYEPDTVTELGLEAAPYLTSETGKRWKNIEELELLLLNMPVFSPRKWVLEHQTNATAFGNFLRIVDDIR